MSLNHHYDEEIPLYALGGMSREESEALRAHLRECPHCRARWQEARNDVSWLAHSVEPVRPSAETRNRLMARVEADLSDRRRSRRPRREGILSRAWRALSARIHGK